MEMFTESASRGLLAHTHHRTTKYIFLPLVSCGLASVWAHLGATGLAGEKTGLIDLSLLILDEWDSFSGEIGYRKRV
jgi:hypothetical protein